MNYIAEIFYDMWDNLRSHYMLSGDEEVNLFSVLAPFRNNRDIYYED